MLTRLCLDLNHLNGHMLKHGFNDILNLICIFGGDIESINQFFLHCLEYCEARQILFDNTQIIDKMWFSQNQSLLTHLLSFGDSKRNSNVNVLILKSAMELVLSSGIFNGSLFNGV